jgi:hypothetical protein
VTARVVEQHRKQEAQSRRQAEFRDVARQLIERSCHDQNIPFHVEDPSVLNDLAMLLLAQREHVSGRATQGRRHSGGRRALAPRGGQAKPRRVKQDAVLEIGPARERRRSASLDKSQ